MKLQLLTLLTCCAFLSYAQTPVGIFDDHVDVGNPKQAGSASYDASNQVYNLKGAGYNIWFGRDEFQYAFKKVKGDFVLTANFEFVGKGLDPHRKIGWMVRNTTDDNSAHITATVHGDGLTVLQWRLLRGALMRDPQDEIFFSKKSQIIQLERTGKNFIMRVANWGEPLQVVGSKVMDAISDEVLAGLFISSHNEEAMEEAMIWNVRIDKPVPADYNTGSSGFLVGCRMETMTIFDGKRKVIRESAGRFEAPNWMPDGKKLLFNEGGSLFTIPIGGGTPEKINTDFADRNNNDHMISFDGKTIALSHNRTAVQGGGSTVYTVPISGGTPKQITDRSPSYLHGWNPNNKEVVFVGQRDGKNYDIYKISVNGGTEVKLTSNTSYHVDGCEYSPDGKYIYYNGSPTGTMQLWRMKPDGTGNEQLTFDEYNNWFPHISPDGKWIAFISFPPDIDPKSHPSYKRVMLRLMPT
ncbi:MAG: TolB family protein, partial [Bacteroidia bacterium]|nr:TolB family protein [Bacteroidia bacterium]